MLRWGTGAPAAATTSPSEYEAWVKLSCCWNSSGRRRANCMVARSRSKAEGSELASLCMHSPRVERDSTHTMASVTQRTVPTTGPPVTRDISPNESPALLALTFVISLSPSVVVMNTLSLPWSMMKSLSENSPWLTTLVPMGKRWGDMVERTVSLKLASHWLKMKVSLRLCIMRIIWDGPRGVSGVSAGTISLTALCMRLRDAERKDFGSSPLGLPSMA
mmetsp:Transcript_14143/g.45118  ORF Transcript_14143/g.45118 Transcript_14143/m.45118 type:complete len:219 (-) Transcript_14143:267-923(-)